MRIKGYMANCDYSAERVGDDAYDKARAVTSKWEPVKVKDLPSSYCGNIATCLDFDLAKKSFVRSKDFRWNDPKRISLYQAVPSALALYRILCLFKCFVDSEGPEGYKTVWTIGLKHKASGEILILREWKGGFSLGHDGHGPIPAMEADLIDLLNLLVAPDCPHPYDGTVAGSVA